MARPSRAIRCRPTRCSSRGIARLERWGLIDEVVESGAPATRHVRFDQGFALLDGDYPRIDGVDVMFSPRRTVLDEILVDAARRSGATMRESFVVQGIMTDGRRVTGIRGREKGGPEVTETARIVVGADGKRSSVAQAVGAPIIRERPIGAMACYTYWEGVPVKGGEIYGRDRRALGVWPTNDGLVLTYLAWPVEEFAAFRSDFEANAFATFDLAGDLGERIRSGRRAERWRMSPDLPNQVRTAFGPGWALVGDAGLVMDPITGQGIGHAFRQAESLAGALEAGFGGAEHLATALARFQRERDRDILPMFEFTANLATFPPPGREQRALMAAIADRPDEIGRFLALLSGAIPMPEYFSPGNLVKLVGARAMAKMALGRMRSRGAPVRTG